MANSSSYAFGKDKRLLVAADYKNVFDNNEWKVSNKESLCLSVKNDKQAPRLGLVIAKKNVKLAVHRNRIKRIIRDSFRLHQHVLPNADIVILARRGLGEKTNAEIHKQFEDTWRRLIKKANKSPTS
ncbi:MAG: ribonuclease P protein component [Pseudomonadales bacterium]|nr:ribonuclease P protein component [Pseudomonadales bacterium]